MDATRDLTDRADRWAKNIPAGSATQITAHVLRLDARLAERRASVDVSTLVDRLDMERNARLPLWEVEVTPTDPTDLGEPWDDTLCELQRLRVTGPVSAATADHAADVVARRIEKFCADRDGVGVEIAQYLDGRPVVNRVQS